MPPSLSDDPRMIGAAGPVRQASRARSGTSPNGPCARISPPAAGCQLDFAIAYASPKSDESNMLADALTPVSDSVFRVPSMPCSDL